MKKITIVLFLICTFSACSSLVEKGDKLYESGMFSEAAEFYEKALHKDPDNVEAKLGLNRARYKIIDRGLIEVRMLRLSSNYTVAAQKLEQILRNQLAWDVELDSAISATQAEETRYAIQWLLKEADSIVKNAKYPDKFRWLNHAYGQLIANGRLQASLDKHRDVIWQKGADRCSTVAADVGGQRFFLKDFSQTYCSAWGQPPNLLTDRYDNSRFNHLDVHSNYQVYGASQQRQVVEGAIQDLQQQFLHSPWYAEQGQHGLRISFFATLDYSYRRRRESRKATYMAKEIVTYKDLDGQEREASQDIERTYPYRVNIHQESFSADMKFDAKVHGKPIVKTINKSQNQRSEEHSEDFPAANLSPQTANLLDRNAMVLEYINSLNSDFLAALDAMWQSTYCGKAAGDRTGENILRCALVEPNNSAVNTWFTQKFGITYLQMSELYGFQQ